MVHVSSSPFMMIYGTRSSPFYDSGKSEAVSNCHVGYIFYEKCFVEEYVGVHMHLVRLPGNTLAYASAEHRE